MWREEKKKGLKREKEGRKGKERKMELTYLANPEELPDWADGAFCPKTLLWPAPPNGLENEGTLLPKVLEPKPKVGLLPKAGAPPNEGDEPNEGDPPNPPVNF